METWGDDLPAARADTDDTQEMLGTLVKGDRLRQIVDMPLNLAVSRRRCRRKARRPRTSRASSDFMGSPLPLSVHSKWCPWRRGTHPGSPRRT
ncbi:NgoMIV family type II restriction endonuclease [Corynebacterium mastitidis]